VVWNKAVFCLKVAIYKRLQIWRHNYVIGRNEYLISTLSESTMPQVYSLYFFLNLHITHGDMQENVRVFFWTQCIDFLSEWLEVIADATFAIEQVLEALCLLTNWLLDCLDEALKTGHYCRWWPHASTSAWEFVSHSPCSISTSSPV